MGGRTSDQCWMHQTTRAAHRGGEHSSSSRQGSWTGTPGSWTAAAYGAASGGCADVHHQTATPNREPDPRTFSRTNTNPESARKQVQLDQGKRNSSTKPGGSNSAQPNRVAPTCSQGASLHIATNRIRLNTTLITSSTSMVMNRLRDTIGRGRVMSTGMAAAAAACSA